MSATVDDLIDLEILELLHGKVSDQLSNVNMRREGLDGEAEELQSKLDRIEARMAEFYKPALQVLTPRTPTGRVKKGASKPIVIDFIKSSNGIGVTVKQIIASTGTKYGTVHRLIKELADASEIESAGKSRWRWKQNNLLATKENGEARATSNGEAEPLF